MSSSALKRFEFIGHALRGDGPFRPTVSYDGEGHPVNYTNTYLNRYPRESVEKFARRVDVAFYSSPLARTTSKFTGYIGAKKTAREFNNELLQVIANDTDGKGNDIDIFWQAFMVNAKARGSMLLLVDMPKASTSDEVAGNLRTQLDERIVPVWTPIDPELLTEYELGDDGKFNFAQFTGTYEDEEGKKQDCEWYFDRAIWQCIVDKEKIVSQGEHPLGECPLLILTETTDFPGFGPFAPIADIAKRLYNMQSEKDEILRSQTFSILTFEVPEDSSTADRVTAAQTVGATIGTNNLLMYSGSRPDFIAPGDGPAMVYIQDMENLQDQINEIGLDVSVPNQREAALTMQIRFQSLNAELGVFSKLMEGLERRAWELTGRWLGLQELPTVAWPRDFNISDTQQELDILSDMVTSAMPPEVIAAQQIKVVNTQFSAIDIDDEQNLSAAIERGLSDG